MVIIALTDLHGSLAHIEAIGEEMASADVVLLAGDLTSFGRRKETQTIVEALQRYNRRILAVMGNCDYPEVQAYLDEHAMGLHRGHAVVDGVAFVGLGGSLHCPIPTLNEWTEEEVASHLNEAVADLPSGSELILLSHQPPSGTQVDVVETGQHVGSASVRAFIEEHQPLACFSGHIHEARGLDAIGATQLVNPGPFIQGGYAYAQVSQGHIAIELRQAT